MAHKCVIVAHEYATHRAKWLPAPLRFDGLDIPRWRGRADVLTVGFGCEHLAACPACVDSRPVVTCGHAWDVVRPAPDCCAKCRVKCGARSRHGRYVIFQLAEAAVPRALVAEILCRIDRLRPRLLLT